MNTSPIQDMFNDQSGSNYFDIGKMRIQWGVASSTSGTSETITLPAAFANTSYALGFSVNYGGSNVIQCTWSEKTTTTFTYEKYLDTGPALGTSTAEAADWIAIGLKP